MTSRTGVAMSWVNTVLLAAERCGQTREQVLRHAGLQAPQSTGDRWPIDDMTRLWRSAVALCKDPAFGLKVGCLVGPASFNIVSFLFQSSATLRETIAAAQKYHRLISDGGRFQLIAADADSWLIYHPQQGELAFSPHQIESVLAGVVTFSRWVSGESFLPSQVQFDHARLGSPAAYREAFGMDADFEQAFSGIRLPNALLDRPLPQGNVQLAQLHREYAAAQLASLDTPLSLTEQVRHWIAIRIANGIPDRSAAAQHFRLNDRAFSRQLHSEGASYTDVVDTFRKEAAVNAVANSTRSFLEIAHWLGFSEASAFNRAFKRWTGQTPGDWRDRQTVP